MSSPGSQTKTPTRLRLRITARAESILRSGHPWLFAESVVAQNRPGDLGELGVVYDRRDRFLALGLFDPESPLRLRILLSGKPHAVDGAFWSARFEAALTRRERVADAGTDGLRLIHGESDGWPGLVLDRYAGTLVLKCYTAAWMPWLDLVLETIRGRLQPERVVLRLSRNIQERARTSFGRQDGQVLWGLPIEGPILFRETGLQFEADVLRGQKTGFFLDQRENRRRVEGLAGGRRVLNAFSFTGGFSLYAARGGARSVTDVDISAHALAAARRHFELNKSLPLVAQCRHETVQADVFDWLGTAPKRNSSTRAGPGPFDLVILDPPSLAKREAEKAGAIHAYGRLTRLGIEQLVPGGLLVACSCSAHVTADEFFGTVQEAARKSGIKFSVRQTTLHAADHPTGFAEANYLKGIYLEVKRAC
jgi:23S rRNA (cytosine1962-C5)-methyltransferase